MKDLPTEQWKLIIQRLAGWGILSTTLVGGEPTTRKDLTEIVSQLRNNGILPSLISNFARMDRRMIDDLAEAGLFSLQASIDSLRGNGRGHPAWLDSLQYARNIGILPLVSSVVTSKNVDEIPALAEEITARGIPYNCSLYQQVGGVFSVVVDFLKPSPDKLDSALRQLEAIKRRTGLVRTTYRYLHNVDEFYKHNLWHCNPSADAWINVNTDGTLMPCQEYESTIHVLDIADLQDERWRQVKESTASSCPGCYCQCYFEQETAGWRTLIQEIGPITIGWGLLSPR